MKKLIINKTERDPMYHEFTYKDGHKTPIEKDGLTRLYISESGMLKATERVDIAGSVSGKYVETDEVQSDHGKPCVNGHSYDIFGATEEGVYLTAARDTIYHSYDIDTPTKKVQVSPNNPRKQADCELLRQIYMMLV